MYGDGYLRLQVLLLSLLIPIGREHRQLDR